VARQKVKFLQQKFCAFGNEQFQQKKGRERNATHNTPSIVMLPTQQRLAQGNERRGSKWRGEDISKLMLGINPTEEKISIFNMWPKMMVFQSNMASSRAHSGSIS